MDAIKLKPWMVSLLCLMIALPLVAQSSISGVPTTSNDLLDPSRVDEACGGSLGEDADEGDDNDTDEGNATQKPEQTTMIRRLLMMTMIRMKIPTPMKIQTPMMTMQKAMIFQVLNSWNGSTKTATTSPRGPKSMTS